MRKGFTLPEVLVVIAILAVLISLLFPIVGEFNLRNGQPSEIKNVICTKTFEYQDRELVSKPYRLIAVFKDDKTLISLLCEPEIYAKVNQGSKYNIKYRKTTYSGSDGYLREVTPLD